MLFKDWAFLPCRGFWMGALYGGWLGVRAVLFILGFEKVISEDKAFLLHHVDFAELRDAADELHEQTLKANAFKEQQVVGYSSDNKDLPPALRILKPTHIFVEKERVCIEFGGPTVLFWDFRGHVGSKRDRS